MATIQNNTAAWLTGIGEKLVVRTGPDQTTPGIGEIVVKVAVAAVAPFDYKVQDDPPFPIQYPTVLGCDVAGIVAKVGPGVNRFKVGDRVMAYSLSVAAGPSSGGFQDYSTCLESLTAIVPDSIPLEEAVVSPSSLATAIDGLFDILKLDLPVVNKNSGPPKGIVLVWGGSGSVGSQAVLLASAADYHVVTTASPKNHDYVTSLAAKGVAGSVKAFNHAQPNVVDDIAAYIRQSGLTFSGVIDCIGTEPVQKSCVQVTQLFGATKVASVLPPAIELPQGLEYVFIRANKPGMDPTHPGAPVFRDFVTPALEAGVFRPAPKATIIEGGLSKVQDAIDLIRKGVSATKLVVKL